MKGTARHYSKETSTCFTMITILKITFLTKLLWTVASVSVKAF